MMKPAIIVLSVAGWILLISSGFQNDTAKVVATAGMGCGALLSAILLAVVELLDHAPERSR